MHQEMKEKVRVSVEDNSRISYQHTCMANQQEGKNLLWSPRCEIQCHEGWHG